MKTVNIEGVRLDESSIDLLKFLQEADVHNLTMTNMIGLNGHLVEQLNANADKNRDFIDWLQSLNVLMKFLQAIE